MLIGLTGRNASGKSTLVGWFSERGLRSVSCSDSIRSWLAEQGIEPTREALIEGGRDLRRRGGGGVLAEMLLDILDGEDAVIDSIRTPAEVEALRSRGDFLLIEVRADEDARWGRMLDRGRSGDPTEKVSFLAQEAAEAKAAGAQPGPACLHEGKNDKSTLVVPTSPALFSQFCISLLFGLF